MSEIKCKPLTEEENATVLMVPALFGTMFQVQDINDECRKLVIDTLNKLEQLKCISVDKDEKKNICNVNLVIHEIINHVDEVKPIVEDTKAKLNRVMVEYQKVLKERGGR